MKDCLSLTVISGGNVDNSSAITTCTTMGDNVVPQTYTPFKYTKIVEVNLCAFAYRVFHEDFSSIDGTFNHPLSM